MGSRNLYHRGGDAVGIVMLRIVGLCAAFGAAWLFMYYLPMRGY